MVFTHSQLQTLSPVDISTDIDPENCTATQRNLVRRFAFISQVHACIYTCTHMYIAHMCTHTLSHTHTHTHCYLHLFKHSNQPCVSCRHPSGYCTHVCSSPSPVYTNSLSVSVIASSHNMQGLNCPQGRKVDVREYGEFRNYVEVKSPDQSSSEVVSNSLSLPVCMFSC